MLIATVLWFGIGVWMALDSARRRRRRSPARWTTGCTVTYISPDGRQQTGEVDCTEVRIGSTRTVWVLSDDPGDVMNPAAFIAGMLITTTVGALVGAGLVRLGRGRRPPSKARCPRDPVTLRVRRLLAGSRRLPGSARSR